MSAAYPFWRGHIGGAGAKFVDHHVAQIFRISGAPVYIHKYLGPAIKKETGGDFPSWDDFVEKGDVTLDNMNPKDGDPALRIQDLFLLENRDRAYSRDIYETKGIYTMEDVTFSLRRFGMFLSSDSIEIDFHYENLIETLGRPLVAGDVLELPHLRQAGFSPENPLPVSRYYVVEDAARAANGWDRHWRPHVWRCHCGPVRDQQEFAQILESAWRDAEGFETPRILRDLLSMFGTEEQIGDALLAEAAREVPFLWFQHAHLYVFPEWLEPHPETKAQPVWRLICFYGDGEPPNASEPVAFGVSFPPVPGDGDWFLRVDFSPPALYRFEGTKWRFVEYEVRENWRAIDKPLAELVSETGTVGHRGTGEQIPKRQMPSKVLRPRRRRLRGVVPSPDREDSDS